jgi:CHAD domain-containing protein/CYTH domain-containing protein
MNIPPNLPILPVDEGARRLALAHLQDAVAARGRVTGFPDADALHDYRVAIRRLRSCLRAYDKPLRSSLTGKTLRRLRRLAHGTNRSRDLDVHLLWLGEQGHKVGEAERPGVTWLLERLTADRDHAWEKMLELDETLFPRIHPRLVRGLTRFRMTIDLDAGPQRRSTAAVTARRVRAAAGRLKERLRRVQGYSSIDAIHRARISAKHLRYLIEPFAAAVPEGAATVERLKALQDGFGDVHDAHVFGAELRAALPDAERAAAAGASLVPGIEALMASLQARGQQAFDQVAAGWLGDAAEPFFTTADALADDIAGLVDRDREVERKFLLTGLPTLPGAESPVEIEQGYLPGERLIERVRRIRSDEGEELVRTVKEGSGLTRLEVEEPVSPDVFDQLWPLTEGRRLRKRRYRIPDGDLTWEIDEFLDRDLVLAEVELAGRPIDVEVPAWLQPHVDREVTEDEAYSNVRLASSS